MNRRVVITGIGPATAAGIGKEGFFNALMGMETRICEVPPWFERHYTFKSRFYVPAPTFALTDYGISKGTEAMMEEISRLSVLCTHLALEDAGFVLEKEDKYFKVKGLEKAMIIMGVGMSSLQTALDSYVDHMKSPEAAGSGATKMARFNRMLIPMSMPNSAAAWISILFGVKGPAHTLNASCASGGMAIGEAWHGIRSGRSDIAIAGGVESLAERNGTPMRGFDMLMALTKSEDGKPGPFSNNRCGFLFCEGAGCVLILEELTHAQARGAHIYAEIAGYECASDACSIVQIEPTGEGIQAGPVR